LEQISINHPLPKGRKLFIDTECDLIKFTVCEARKVAADAGRVGMQNCAIQLRFINIDWWTRG
jgi:hypothetical protein